MTPQVLKFSFFSVKPNINCTYRKVACDVTDFAPKKVDDQKL